MDIFKIPEDIAGLVDFVYRGFDCGEFQVKSNIYEGVYTRVFLIFFLKGSHLLTVLCTLSQLKEQIFLFRDIYSAPISDMPLYLNSPHELGRILALKRLSGEWDVS